MRKATIDYSGKIEKFLIFCTMQCNCQSHFRSWLRRVWMSLNQTSKRGSGVTPQILINIFDWKINVHLSFFHPSSHFGLILPFRSLDLNCAKNSRQNFNNLAGLNCAKISRFELVFLLRKTNLAQNNKKLSLQIIPPKFSFHAKFTPKLSNCFSDIFGPPKHLPILTTDWPDRQNLPHFYTASNPKNCLFLLQLISTKQKNSKTCLEQPKNCPIPFGLFALQWICLKSKGPIVSFAPSCRA